MLNSCASANRVELLHGSFMTKQHWLRVLLYFLLCALALTGNVVSVSFFFGIDLIFGSIFVFLILGYFGFLAAIPASLIAASYTFVLWNHPYAIIIFFAEFLFVGFFFQWRRRNIVFLDALFWVVIGLPLVYIFYGSVMELPRASVLLIMLKQGVNGIFNAFIAYLVINFTPLILRSEKKVSRTISFQTLIFSMLLICISLPALVIISFVGRNEFEKIKMNVVNELNSASFEIEGGISDWLAERIYAVNKLAIQMKEQDKRLSGENQKILELILSLNPDFHNMYVANRKAITTAFYPPVNQKGEPTIGLDFSDRKYYKMLLNGAKLVISDVFQGRGGVFSPIVTISAPIEKQDRFDGFALAALNIEHIKKIIGRETINRQAMVTVIDSQKQVIASTIPGRKALDSYDYEAVWDISKSKDGIRQGFRKEDSALSQIRKWNNSVYLKAIPVPANKDWTIVVEIRMLPHIKRLNQFYMSSLLFVFVLSVIAIALSTLAANRLVSSILRLQNSSNDLPLRTEKGEAISWPRSFILEINELIENFKNTASILASMFEKLHKNQSLLEQRVDERTHDLTVANSDLSQSIERTKTIIDTVQDAIISIDQNGMINLFNRAAERVFQYSADDVKGKNVSILMPSPYNENHDAYIKRYLDTQQPRVIGVGREVNGKRKDGSIFPMRLVVGEMKHADKQIFVGVVSDITVQKQIEADLIKSKEKSEEANRLKSEFLNTMSHELRTPLTVILGNIDELTDKEELPDADEVVDISRDISNAGQHLLRLINDMLDISKIEAGRMELVRDRVDSADLINDAIKTIKKMADDKQIGLVAEGEQTTLFIDPLRMKQVILNLLSNAIKFTDTGEVRVLTSMTDQEFVLKVQDTGLGMDPESLEYIFDPFRQVDGSVKRKTGGTGLGLAITEKLVHLHGGTINVTSEPGKGSEFTVSIPVGSKL